MSTDSLVLAAEFPDATRDQWLAAVDKVLKGADFQKKLVTKTLDGIDIQPIYAKDTAAAASCDQAGFPGAAPYTRGTDPEGQTLSGWDIRQLHIHPDIQVSNAAIKQDLQRGATSISIRFDKAARNGQTPDQAGVQPLAGCDGVMAYSVDSLEKLLHGVDLSRTMIALEAGTQGIPAAVLLQNLWKRQGIRGDQAKGSFGYDPLNALVRTGALPTSLAASLQNMAALAQHTREHWPHVRSFNVDSSAYYEAGCTETQDLAILLATTVEYIRALTAAGVHINDVYQQAVFRIPIGVEQFTTIAKIRAARLVLSRIAEACGATAENSRPHIDAVMSPRVMAQRDPWVNILRGTVSCFSAAVSGAHSITVLPFDYALGQPDEFSQRIARNTQIILQEESSLNRVVDPAGGSWYVETLTQQMAEKAWALFQEIETEGGLIQSLHDGHIQKRIKEKALERFALIATRKMPLTGVSEFPNINEDTIEKDEIDFADLFAAAEAELQNPPAYHGKGIADVLSAPDDVTLGQLADALAGDKCMLPPLPNFSHYKEFEDLRAASDAHLEKTGQRPRIFMATLGPVAQHTARATFAKNFFEAGGIETLPGAAYASAADVAAAFAASGTDFAVVCSSDHQYDSHGQETVRALKAAGAKAIYLAGRMGEDKPAYDAAGVSDYIYVGANVLAVLRDTLDKMGVSR